ncbi:MAG: FAD-binding protein [Pseudaminobacter sp.]|nr:FAD-binding protein [Pseudaminobacter sp.]
MAEQADSILVGDGLAGLVAAAELRRRPSGHHYRAGRRELARRTRAFWSLGWLYFVDSPEQRRLAAPNQPSSVLGGFNPVAPTNHQ